MPVSAATQPDTHYIHFFGGENPTVASEAILGGKGHSLAMMSNAGLPVPPGFTISSECCRIFHAEKKWPAGLEDEIEKSLAWLEAKTGATFGAMPRPLLVAVRSGAAVSMPGMMDTVLNVGLRPELEGAFPDFWEKYRDFIRHYGEIVAGLSEHVFESAAALHAKEQALKFLDAYRAAAGHDFPTDPRAMIKAAIDAVFNSWNSERAIRYRARNDVRNLAGTAVNVQSMCPSELSGVLFTEDPNQPEARRILIEGTTGLGEALVLGRVEPDVFIVDRGTMKIAERSLSDVSTHLTDAQVDELAQMGLSIEKYFGFPVDIEWGYAGGKFSLLQSRRIRGLDIGIDVPIARTDEIERLRHIAGSEKRTWAIHNLGETLAAPTPLTWDFIGGFMNRGGFIELYKALGFMPSKRVLQEGFLELICGKVYACANRSAELFYDDYPLDYDLSEGKAEQLLGPPTKFNFERAGGGFLLKLPWFLFKMYRSGKVLREALGPLHRRLRAQAFAGVFGVRRGRAREESQRAQRRRIARGIGYARPRRVERIRRGDFEAGISRGVFSRHAHWQTFHEIFGKEEAARFWQKLLRGLSAMRRRRLSINIALYEAWRAAGFRCIISLRNLGIARSTNLNCPRSAGARIRIICSRLFRTTSARNRRRRQRLMRSRRRQRNCMKSRRPSAKPLRRNWVRC